MSLIVMMLNSGEREGGKSNSFNRRTDSWLLYLL